MARIIDKQPDGKYRVWSTIIDDYILVDATPDDIIDLYIKEAKEEIAESVKRQVKKLG